MTSHETLECRIYVAEDAMYRRSDDLNLPRGNRPRQISAEAERVSSLKGLIADFELEVAESAPGPSSETTPGLEVLAATVP